MHRVLLPMLLLALAICVPAVENQAFLGIFAETRVMKMAGMPEMPALPPGMAMPPGMVMPGAPQRSLTVRLWSPNLAPKDAFAYILPPAGLKQGKRLDLGLYRPKPDQTTAEGTGAIPEGGKEPKFTIKIYWGSSEKVRENQPKIIRYDGLTDEQKAEMKKQAQQARAAVKESYFYKPNWTTGYWPTPKQPGKIAMDASLVGKYSLTTNYTGNVEITAPDEVDFLAPIELTSPSLAKKVAMEPALKLQWKAIPHALGLHAVIMGMEGENTIIIWSSSEVYSDLMMSPEWDYMQMARVRQLVEETVMMKGDATKASVPAGIFKNCDMVHMSMVGFGPGAALAEAQPLPRIQTKTHLTAMLGGKQMEDMGDEDMGDEDEE